MRTVLLFLVTVTLSGVAGAQPAGQPEQVRQPHPARLTAEVVEQQRKQANESQELDDETKKRVADLYRQAAEQLQRTDELAANAGNFKTRTESVQEEVARFKTQLEALSRAEAVRPPTEPLREPENEAADLPPVLRRLKRTLAVVEHERTQLQLALAKRELRLQELHDEQTKFDAEPATRASRRQEIRALLLSTPQRLEDVERQLAAQPPADEPQLLTLAKRSELQSRRLVIQSETPTLQNELAMYDAEDVADVLRLQRDWIIGQVSLATKEVELADQAVRAARDRANKLGVQVAAEEAVHAQPLLAPYARRNAKLAQEADSLTPLLNQAEADLNAAHQVLGDLSREFEQTKTKVEIVGLSHAIGAMLRKQRASLPDVRSRRDNVRNRRETIDDAQLAYFTYDDERSQLQADPEQEVARILGGASPLDKAANEAAREELRRAAEHAVDSRKEYLDALRGNYNTYFDTLVELSAEERQIIAISGEFSNYIDERVLWIRSSKPLTLQTSLDEADARFLSPAHWSTIATRLWSDMRGNVLLYATVLVLLALLVYVGGHTRQEITEIGAQVARGSFSRYTPTLRAALLTILISVPWPGLALFLAWRLTGGVNGTEFTRAVGSGLFNVAIGFLPLELFRQFCRPQGLADAHFEWPLSAIAVLRRNLKFLILLALPLAFVTSTLYAGDAAYGVDFLERVLFIVGTVLVAAFLWHVLRPSGGVLQEHIAYHQGGWIDRLQRLWYWMGVLSPLVLGLLAFVGYYYTAKQLSGRLFVTLWLVVGLVVARAFLLRLLIVKRRQIAMERMRERRAETAAEADAAAGVLGPQSIAPAEDPLEELREQTEQTRRLLNTALIGAALVGIWLAWVNVLPALSLLDRWPLWTTTDQVTEIISGGGASESPAAAPLGGFAAAAVQTRTRDVVDHVTIADLAFAVLVCVITFFAARNVPGLTEIAVLQRLPLDQSVRYAIKALVSYAIAIVGLVVACNTIGLRWQQVQWMATALTFGLAFGLQEMFANFVAGIILLFERPIRVGDVVTIDDITGVVSRIRIRATTITNWDRKEFVVPNKEFITGRLLNWTLSDKVNRIVINIGIAYGADTEKAKDLLLRAANDHPQTLDDPPTMATFEGFGDNALNFTLRTFLPSMESRLTVIHELHTSIDQAFRQAGIEIAFPQRDLHIRSLPEAMERSGTGFPPARAKVPSKN